MNRELLMLNLISKDSEQSQRRLAKEMDLSLGTINAMIQEMEKNNTLVTKRINARKVEYILTKKGQDYHNKLYVAHISECFDTVSLIRQRFKLNINQLVDDGIRYFIVKDKTDELVRITKMCFLEIKRKIPIDYMLLEEEVLSDIEVGQEPKTCAVIGWDDLTTPTPANIVYKNLLS